MKLVIQIPCFNEEKTLPETLADLPKQIPGIDVIEVQIIDDGSTDKTREVAESLGVKHIVSLGSNRGLAFAFSAGVQAALARGADILINTDADNQYYGGDIPKLVAPILENKADIVVGCRPIVDHPEFSPLKKKLQLLGSSVLRWISGTNVRDAPSGFRAFSRMACQRIFIHSRFSYCMETLIQAGTTGLRIASVDIRVNPSTRSSRLFKSIPQYLKKTGGTMLSMFLLYRPGRFFAFLSVPFFLVAVTLGIRFLWLVIFLNETGRAHLSSLVLLILCTIAGFMLVVVSILGMLHHASRRLSEETIYLLRKSKDNMETKEVSSREEI